MSKVPPQHDLLVGLLLVQGHLDRRSETFFDAFGLTAAQFNILNLLGRHKGTLEQASVVELLLVGKSSVSIVLNRMVRDGFVERKDHPEDRRRTLLNITAKGRSTWRKILPSYESGVEEIFSCLPLSRRQAFFEDLKCLHCALAKAAGVSAADIESQWRSFLRPIGDQ